MGETDLMYIARHDMKWNGMEWHDPKRYALKWHGMALEDTGMVWHSEMEWFSLISLI